MKPIIEGGSFTPKVATLVAYLIPPISSGLILFLEREDKQVRFHAWQATLVGTAFYLLILALQILSTLVGFAVSFLGILIGLWIPILILLGFVGWGVCLYKAYVGQELKIPYFSTYAEKWSGV